MTSTVYPAALSHFAVFCPALGPDEDTTHEQLLFYSGAALPAFYPYSANDYYARTTPSLRRRRSSGSSTSSTHITPTGNGRGERVVSLDMKLREIGLAAAVVTFANSFGTEKTKFYTVRSEKRRTVVFEAEPGILVQLAIVLPRRVERAPGKEKDTFAIEFLDSEVSDQALQAWVEAEYWAFRLLFGPLQRALRGEQQTVRRQLDAFFGRTMARWDHHGRWTTELDLGHALRPLPQMAVGSISLGGFVQLWADLSEVSGVEMAVILWQGKEIVWRSQHPGARDWNHHVLRALVAWSRAAFAPAFAPFQSVAPAPVAPAPAPVAPSGSSSGSWLWGWRTSNVGAANQSDSSPGSSDSDTSSAGGGGGISQALSRAVNALVEPRAPTPPTIDPVFASSSPEGLGDYEDRRWSNTPFANRADSDAESVRSVASSVRTTRTAATVGVSRHSVTARLDSSVGRSRSTTIQHGYWPLGRVLANGRTPSVMSAESAQLRDDSRVSARSWWPSILGGGATKQPEPVLADDYASGVDAATTFVFTGEHVFPGVSSVQRQYHVDDVETVSLLGSAMDDRLPAAYAHGVDVDADRGVVLAPRGHVGMQYDSRLLRLTHVTPAPDRPLHVTCSGHYGGSRTLAYKYGELLIMVFGEPSPAASAPALARGANRRNRRGRLGEPLQPMAEPEFARFDDDVALAIEAVVLRYAAGLLATCARDAADERRVRSAEAQLLRARRVPPYMIVEHGQSLLRTNWVDGVAPVNRSFEGFHGESGNPEPLPLTVNVRRALSVVNAEIAHQQMVMCVRMKDKGWVAASSSVAAECYCVVDLPNATLADALAFLNKLEKRAISSFY
ncbi:hypothetical protein GGI20_002147 [Coemansia sp. BCRC 34301]|nr:hypothetical protein GGI20_002147 [Coemansia sp. BCRC 34301]